MRASSERGVRRLPLTPWGRRTVEYLLAHLAQVERERDEARKAAFAEGIRSGELEAAAHAGEEELREALEEIRTLCDISGVDSLTSRIVRRALADQGETE